MRTSAQEPTQSVLSGEIRLDNELLGPVYYEIFGACVRVGYGAGFKSVEIPSGESRLGSSPSAPTFLSFLRTPLRFGLGFNSFRCLRDTNRDRWYGVTQPTVLRCPKCEAMHIAIDQVCPKLTLCVENPFYAIQLRNTHGIIDHLFFGFDIFMEGLFHFTDVRRVPNFLLAHIVVVAVRADADR